MLYFLAILSISALFLCCALLVMARDPRRWRHWWMTRMGIPDLNNSREQKRSQEFKLILLTYVLFFILLTTSIVCAWLVFDGIHELRNKSAYDHTREKTQQEVEKFKGKFKKLR